MTSPLDILLPYQRAWVADDARFKAGIMARQTGKSFGAAAELTQDCLARQRSEWTVLSAGERQAIEFMRKVHLWAEAWGLAVAAHEEIRDYAESVIKAAETRFANGSVVRAIPANPDTARGYSSNLLLDEFAFHERPDEIWRAVFPIISNPLRGALKIRLISTPNGQGNKFHEIVTKLARPDGPWSVHRVNIHDAVAAGLPLDVGELRSALNDPDGWAQEYECQFIDSVAVLLPYELIAACESAEAAVATPGFWETRTPRWPRVMGIDFGRKRDLTVAWTDELVGDLTIAREVLELDNVSTPEQVERLRPRLRLVSRACLDYTGPGVGLGDYLVKEFGEYAPARHKFGKVELCQFSNGLLTEVFPKLRMRFEQRGTRVPAHRGIRESLHAVHRAATPGGRVTYRAPHLSGGHADHAYAKALANRAAESASGAFEFSNVAESRERALHHARDPLL